MHAQRGLWSPTDHPQVRATLAGIKRRHPYAKRQARPFYLDDLATALGSLADSPTGIRDRAILLAGWWGAFRRSELVGLDVDGLTDDAQGVIINLRHSKTDQEGQGRLVPLHYHENSTCPVRALRAWTGIVEPEGPLFRQIDQWGRTGSRPLSCKTVGRVVKDAAASLGFRPEGLLGALAESGVRVRMRPPRNPIIGRTPRHRSQERGDARDVHQAAEPVRIISWSLLLTLLSPIGAITFSLSETSLHAR